MPRSLETKAALEVNAGLLCLAGVAVFPHRYVAVPLFLNLLLKVVCFQTTFLFIDQLIPYSVISVAAFFAALLMSP